MRWLDQSGGSSWGFSFSHNKEPKRRIAPKALVRCKLKIRELTQRTRGISLEQMMKELAAYLRGWKSYFGFRQTPSLLKALDKWIRHRLRFHDLEAMEARPATVQEATPTWGW